jgi:NADH-quinone oxidoreductase subunit D
MPTIKVPLGPQHPALKEPESFKFELDGERVVGVDVRMGYAHRGIEKGFEARTYTQGIYLAERICGICSHSHTTPFVQNAEELLKLEIPPRARYIRVLFGELERIHSHLLWLGVAGHEVGFDSLFMYTWRDRELVMDMLELISGNRVHYGMNTVGGVRRDISADQAAKLLEMNTAVLSRTDYYIKMCTAEPTFMARISGVGPLTRQEALDLNAVGPMARASGVKRDVRKDDPYAAYGEVPFEVITADSCDILGRAVVRVFELLQSVKIVEYVLKNMPAGDIKIRAPRKIPAGEAISRYEAPRGENIHFMKSNGTEKPDRVKVRAPTYANMPATIVALKGAYVADIPITVAAIDPCFCCADRMVRLVDDRTGRNDLMTWPQLQRYSREWLGRNRQRPVRD